MAMENYGEFKHDHVSIYLICVRMYHNELVNYILHDRNNESVLHGATYEILFIRGGGGVPIHI